MQGEPPDIDMGFGDGPIAKNPKPDDQIVIPRYTLEIHADFPHPRIPVCDEVFLIQTVQDEIVSGGFGCLLRYRIL